MADPAPARKTYNRKTTVAQDLKDIVRDIAYLASPASIRNRKADVDDAVRKREGQSTDSNNKY